MQTTKPSSTSAIVAIRPASEDDAGAVRVLAALDSAPVPHGPLLLGVVDGEPVAALSLSTGAIVADPFRLTGDTVALLELRAARLAACSAAPTAAAGRPARLAFRRRAAV